MRRLQRSDAGFSLIELLAALAIVALLMAMVPGTLKLGKRAWETGQSGQERAAGVALAFVQERLSGALPIFKSDSSGLQHLMFAGTSQSVTFLAELASGPRGSGLYAITLGTDASGKPNLSLSPYDPEGENSAGVAEARDLSGGMTGLRLRYFGAANPGEPAQWFSAWSRDDRLPDLVEIAPDPQPAVIVEMRMRPL